MAMQRFGGNRYIILTISGSCMKCYHAKFLMNKQILRRGTWGGGGGGGGGGGLAGGCSTIH